MFLLEWKERYLYGVKMVLVMQLRIFPGGLTFEKEPSL
jgi:hypothetical protein